MRGAEQRTAEGILFTDQYQLTMAQLYYRMGWHEKPAQFDHYFRAYPDYGGHMAGYCICAGLEWLLDWLEVVRFRTQDLELLRGQQGQTGKRLFDDDFLDWLARQGTFGGISLRAIPEGRVVHPHVPLTVVQGPLAMAQILESPLLNFLNYQTLVATKAARVQQAGRGQPLLEFGLRRGHGTGVNAGTRAALIGGADFTSNVGISHVLGQPPKGTHAHSLVQTFLVLGEGELAAFRAYADVYPDDCLLLVDTIDTLQSGIPNAIRVFEELKRKGHRPLGIRLDSGDLAYLSLQAAKMLDAAGFADAQIVLSNQLDEVTIVQIISQIEEEAPACGLDADRLIARLVFGVGTRLITSQGDAALDGVYKLVALREGKDWVPAIKISETPAKTINPGDKRSWRLYDHRGKATADLLGLAGEDPHRLDPLVLHHPTAHGISRSLAQGKITRIEPLLVDVLASGKRVCDLPDLAELRRLRREDIERLDAGVRRLVNPHTYHVSLTERLWDLKQDLVAAARRRSP